MFIKILLALTLSFSLLQSYDGKWGHHYEVPKYMAIATIGTSLVFGNNSRFGQTTWQSLDALWMSALATEAIKHSVERVRPRDADEYDDQWFQSGNQSFPSGHVSSVTAMVTPFILEYQKDSYWYHLLWLLPAQQMVGRVKEDAHYPTDVAAGFALGFASGYLAHSLDVPVLLMWKDDGVYVGLDMDF